MWGDVLEAIVSRLEAFPEDPLIEFAGETTTAGSLHEQVLELSARLRGAGVTRRSRVGLALPPSPAFLTAMVATWLSEASFVPLPLDGARVRTNTMLAESAAQVVLTPSDDYRSCAIEAMPTGVSAREAGPDDEAYVIFTSGSTGTPRGVSVGHAAIGRYVREAIHHLRIPDAGTRFAFHLPPSFDAHLTSTLLPLVSRNSIVPLTSTPSSTHALSDFVSRSASPIVVKTTPLQVRLLRTALKGSRLSELEATFVIGGEQLYYEDLDWLVDVPTVRIFNEYGPTEATVGCSYHEVDEPGSGAVPIGIPHRAATFYVLDGEDVLDGASEGELAISGPVLATGYINSPDDERFCVGPDGRRFYRTGDTVRRDEHGTYSYVGRVDDQVKVAGCRVELGEVDAALRVAYEADAASVLTTHGIVGCVAAPRMAEDGRARLASLLPAYMRPLRVYSVASIPSTHHGKIDRSSLSRQLSEADREAPGV